MIYAIYEVNINHMIFPLQDDVVMGTLTVRENIAFSANLRLSNELYDEEARKKKVEEVIVQLGLEACADTKVWCSVYSVKMKVYLQNVQLSKSKT